MAALDDRLHPLLAGEDRAAVHAHPAGAADHHPAALAVRERPVVAVLDDVEDVEQAGPLGRFDLVGLQLPLAVLVDAPDLERDVHRRPFPGMDGSFAHSGSSISRRTSAHELLSSGPSEQSFSISRMNSSMERTWLADGASASTSSP